MIKDLLKKNKEIISYLFFGGCSTIVSILSYSVSRIILENIIICNTISWICAIIFAYITNKYFVFNSKNKNKKETTKEIIYFLISRLITLLIETLLLYILVNKIMISEIISKVISQIVVIILNYILSKIFVFKGD